MQVNILHRSIFDGGLISSEHDGHFINVCEGQGLRIAMAGHVLKPCLIPITQSLCLLHRITAATYHLFDV